MHTLMIELLKRLEIDDDRDQMMVTAPNYYRENRKRFLRIKKQLEAETETPPNKYSIVGIDPETGEELGHVIDVHETFIAVHSEGMPFTLPKLKEISKRLGLDVVVAKTGTEFKVMKVIKPRT